MDLVVSREWLLVSSYERCRQFIPQRFGAVHRFATRSFGLELSCRIGFCDYDKSHDLAQQAAAVHNTQGINSNESGSPYRQEVHTAKGTATKTPTISAADQFPSVMHNPVAENGSSKFYRLLQIWTYKGPFGCAYAARPGSMSFSVSGGGSDCGNIILRARLGFQ
jgi:hypothetical protein